MLFYKDRGNFGGMYAHMKSSTTVRSSSSVELRRLDPGRLGKILGTICFGGQQSIVTGRNPGGAVV